MLSNSNNKIYNDINSDFNNILNKAFPSDITSDAYTCYFNNTFLVFKTINDLHYLVYISKARTIICSDLYHLKKIAEIKVENEKITTFRHYLDKLNNKDLILTLCPMHNKLRIWDVSNWRCFIYINKVYNGGVLYSACFLNDNNENYIITSNCNYFGDSELIKIFDFKGNKIREINESNDATLIIDIYEDKKSSKKYIVTGNKNYLKSFDYENKRFYKKYYEKFNNAHFNYIIDDKNEIVKLFDICEDGYIRIWNFHSGIMINKILVSRECLYDLCLWDENNLLVSSQDKTIKLVDLKSNKVVKSMKGHNHYVITLQKINHIKYGAFLLSHGFENDQIKIWKIEN